MWILGSGLGSGHRLAEHVEALLGRLEGKDEVIADLAGTCTVELFLGFGSENGQGGDVLPASMLSRLGSLGIDVVLDLYPPASDEDLRR